MEEEVLARQLGGSLVDVQPDPERYLLQGKSWGDGGAKRAVAEILSSLDRDSILRDARSAILARLNRKDMRR